MDALRYAGEAHAAEQTGVQDFGHRCPKIRRQFGGDGGTHKGRGPKGKEGPRERGPGPRRGRLGDGQDHGQAPRARGRGRKRSFAARDRSATLDRRATVCGAPGDGFARSGGRRDLALGVTGGDEDHRQLRLGGHLRDTTREDAQPPRRRTGRHRRRFSGHERSGRRNDFGARRVGHDRRRPGGGSGSGSVRDLHGRRRHLHGGPEDSARGAADKRDLVLRDGGDGVAGGGGGGPPGGGGLGGFWGG